MDFNKDQITSLSHIRYDFWQELLDLPVFKDKLPKKEYEKFISKIDQLTELDFNEYNINLLLNSLIQNFNQMFKDSLIDFFKDVTKYHQKEFSKNIHYYNGWETNEAYYINKKIIIPITSSSYFYFNNNQYELSYSIEYQMNEFNRAFGLLVNKTYSKYKNVDVSTWENELLKFKIFKKETIHIWFKDLEALNKLNIFAGKEFNWLPTDEEIHKDTKAKDFMNKIFPDLNILKIKN